MITAIYFRDRVIEPYGHVGDVFVIGDKKYRVINQKNPKYDSYAMPGERTNKYFWGFEEVEE